MSLFYKSQSLTSALVPALHRALTTETAAVAKPQEAAIAAAKEVQAQVVGQLAVGRVVAAFAVLALIFAAGIWCEPHDNLKRWTDVLYDAFKVGLPGLIGLIVGEATAKSG